MAWGLDIESDRVRLCRAERGRRHLRLRRQVEREVPPGLIQPSFKDGNINQTGGLGQLLHALCKDAGCRGWVRVALPDSVFTLRTLATDALPEKRADALRFLRWQARDLVPFPADDTRLDFLPPTPGPDGRLRVICLMASERVLAEYEKALGEAGLRAAVLDARSICLAQAASGLFAQGAVGLLHVGSARSTFVVVEDRLPRFWRILPQGRGAWTEQERNGLIRDIAETISFCHEAEAIGSVHTLLVSGLDSFADEVASTLTDWLGIPTTALDLAAALLAPGHPEDLLPWGPAIGAAIRPC